MLQVYSCIWNKSLQMLTNQYTKKENVLSIFHSNLPSFPPTCGSLYFDWCLIISLNIHKSLPHGEQKVEINAQKILLHLFNDRNKTCCTTALHGLWNVFLKNHS